MIISNNLLGKLPVPDDAIIRVNLAWIKTLKEAKNIIKNSKHDIYLDYPSGRTKPPTPTLDIKDALELAKDKKVKYFALSNAEDLAVLENIKNQLNAIFVPKIETFEGVMNIPEMIEMGIDHIMLDKEDLYIDCECDNAVYNTLLKNVRSHPIKIFELQGVIFI